MRAADPPLSVDVFLDQRFDLPESGQWSELEAGQLVHLQPPDLDHGNTILNLSKVLAEYASQSEGYPCFDLGLLLQRAPDTVWFPAVSYFEGGPRFAESDSVTTETVPTAVIELASTADRRHPMPRRVERYLAWGVREVWVIDPAEQSVQSTSAADPDQPRCWQGDEVIVGAGCFAGLERAVRELFAEPEWWS
jgi:Uma2 family endonuclease